MVAVTGVSGAGKSSLINATLYPALNRMLHGSTRPRRPVRRRSPASSRSTRCIVIDQQPIGRTPRSNPATYTKAFDLIRELFAQIPRRATYGYQAGPVLVQRLRSKAAGAARRARAPACARSRCTSSPNVFVTCEVCKGKRYNDATLRVTYKDKNIAEMLDTPIDEALELFRHHRQLGRIMQTLVDVGLGYVALGQPATTLSGGEAQRVKLARELARVQTGRTLYLLDEPTTGLHFGDVKKLLEVLGRLVDGGNTVLVIEHNLDVIKTRRLDHRPRPRGRRRRRRGDRDRDARAGRAGRARATPGSSSSRCSSAAQAAAREQRWRRRSHDPARPRCRGRRTAEPNGPELTCS